MRERWWGKKRRESAPVLHIGLVVVVSTSSGVVATGVQELTGAESKTQVIITTDF
jgi:hypothetical protein